MLIAPVSRIGLLILRAWCVHPLEGLMYGSNPCPRTNPNENLSPQIKLALQRRYPQIDVLRVGDAGAPAFSTLDPAILQDLQTTQRVLITDNRASMPIHLQDHAAAGGQHWGIFVVRKDVPLGPLIAELHLYWEASEAEEWIDQVEWLAV